MNLAIVYCNNLFSSRTTCALKVTSPAVLAVFFYSTLSLYSMGFLLASLAPKMKAAIAIDQLGLLSHVVFDGRNYFHGNTVGVHEEICSSFAGDPHCRGHEDGMVWRQHCFRRDQSLGANGVSCGLFSSLKFFRWE